MSEGSRFPYLIRPGHSDGTPMPLLPITLSSSVGTAGALGLIDTGSTVNVLPYSLGKELGLAWESGRAHVKLTGSLSRYPAQVVVLMGQILGFEPVRLAFAWTRSEDAPLLLGQINFLLEYEVCFFRSRLEFEVRSLNPPPNGR